MDVSRKTTLIEAQNRVGFELFRRIDRDRQVVLGPDNPRAVNTLISPPAVVANLAVLQAGASGSAREELSDLLALEDPDERLPWKQMKRWMGAYSSPDELLREETIARAPRIDDVQPPVFMAGASLWAKPGVELRDAFVEQAYDEFAVDVRTADFSEPEDREEVERWIRFWTRDEMTRIPGEESPTQRLVSLNTAYFEGSWENPFDPQETEPGPFSPPGGGSREVPMMRQTGDFGYDRGDHADLLRIPYRGGEGVAPFHFYVVLPHRDSDLDAVVDRLNPAWWRDRVEALESRSGRVVLPKIDIRDEDDLGEPLCSLGVEAVFTPGQSRFDRVFEQPEGMYLGRMTQSTFLEVNERGTVAGAVASGVLEAEALQQQDPFEMVVDRPFLAVVGHEKSHAVVFLAAVRHPDPDPDPSEVGTRRDTTREDDTSIETGRANVPDGQDTVAGRDVETDRVHPLSVTEGFQIDGRPLLWRNEETNELVVDERWSADLQRIDILALDPGEEATVGSVKPTLFEALSPRDLALMLVAGEVLRTYIHAGARLRVVEENQDNAVHGYRFEGTHLFYTNERSEGPVAFAVRVDTKTGAISVRSPEAD